MTWLVALFVTSDIALFKAFCTDFFFNCCFAIFDPLTTADFVICFKELGIIFLIPFDKNENIPPPFTFFFRLYVFIFRGFTRVLNKFVFPPNTFFFIFFMVPKN